MSPVQNKVETTKDQSNATCATNGSTLVHKSKVIKTKSSANISVFWFCKVCQPKLKTLLNREVNDKATSVTASIEKLRAEQEQQKEKKVCIRNEVSIIN